MHDTSLYLITAHDHKDVLGYKSHTYSQLQKSAQR